MMKYEIILLKLILVAFLFSPADSLLQYQRLNIKNHNNCHAASSSSSSSSSSNNLQMRLNPTSFKGTDYKITEFPRPALRRVPNAPIVVFDDQSFQEKTQQMIDMMYQAKGVGLAAPQIGLNENLFVYNPTGEQQQQKSSNKGGGGSGSSSTMERIVCNPNITKYSNEVEIEEEGCLSLRSDDCAGQVARSVWIEVIYQNELGQQVRRRLKGFEARVFQHEYDHLKGILCYDRFPPEDREAVQVNIDKLLGLYVDDDAQIEPDLESAQVMQPRPLTARWMPSLESESSAEQEEQEAANIEKKKTKKNKSGFGAGGFGAGSRSSGNKAGKKGEKKKKIKTRNGAFSSNPTFK